jgi:hypothetical protein
MVALPIDPLESAKLRIGRADSLLNQFVAELELFFDKNPPRHAPKLNPEKTHVIHKLMIPERFPVGWNILATEIIEHLRASLDHATFATFRLSTGKMDSNFAAFPFGKTATDLDNSVRGRCKDCPKEIQTLLRGFNAYQGGNDLLYTLNDLANDSKHGLVPFVGGAVLGGEIASTAANLANGVEFYDPFIWDSLKNEIIYARVKAGTDFEHKGKVKVSISIPNTEQLPGGGATGVLDQMGAEVARVVDDIEGKCRDIGLIK